MSARLTVVFSALGHLYIHFFTAFYFVIVLALEPSWRLPYHRLIELWTLGSLMVGAGALPSGILSDRIGAVPMMVAFFIGMGVCSVGAGFTNSTTTLMLALTGIGLFAAIYHPVGIPWLVRNTGRDRGKVLGFNGIFGSLGAAGAGATAGLLIDVAGWRAAFIVPGVVCVLTGIVFFGYAARGRVSHGGSASSYAPAPSRTDMMRGFGILLLTMFLAGMVYHSIQTSLPKVFEERGGALVGSGTLGVGLAVAAVYTVAGVMQIGGGLLADRFPLKPVYLGAMALQVPTLWLAATVSGVPLMVVATVMVMAGAGALPAENMLLARYTPERRHGLAFGLKFALAFGAAPLSVLLVAAITEQTSGFYLVFVVLTGFVVIAMTAAIFLPGDRLPAVAGAKVHEVPAPMDLRS